jgi:hypothetical protein
MPELQDAIDPIGIADGFPGARPYNPTEDDLELATRIKQLFTRAYNAKLSVEKNMDFWNSYARGVQGNTLFRDIDTGDVVRLVPEDVKKLSSVNNQLAPAMRSLLGKLTRMMPTFQYIPPTMDAVEVNSARVVDAFLDYFRRKEDLDGVYTDTYDNAIRFGTGIVQLEWDPMAGRPKAHCGECDSAFDEDLIGTECPVCEANYAEAAALEAETAQDEAMMAGAPPPDPLEQPALQQKIPILEELYEGDCVVHTRDPRDCFPEPGQPNPKKLRYMIYRDTVPVVEVRRRFPEMGMHIGIGRQDQYVTGRERDQDDYLDEHCTLYEYHERPTELYPRGRIVWMANGLILKEIHSPYYKLGRLPFFTFRWAMNPGEFWGESFIANAWHRQRELNNLETSVREYMELLVKQKVLVPIGARISGDEFSASTGQRINYNASAGRVEFLQPPDMPQGVWARRAELSEDIRIQAAVTSQEMGLDVKDPNGRAMAIIEAESDQQTGPITRRNIAEWAALHRGLLVLVADRYDPERKFTVAGEDSYAETFSFAELNLSGGWDLQLEVEDGLSKNQAIRLQQSMDLMNAGAFNDKTTGIPDVNKFARVCKLKIPGIGPDLVSPDYAAAIDMIRQISKGQPAQPQMWDNAEIFAEVLYGWLKTHGRREDPTIVMQVEQAWQFYTQWAVTRIMPPAVEQPTAGGIGGDTSNPGGSANNPGHMASDSMGAQGGGSVGEDASALLAGAGQAAEQQAQVTSSREG